MKVNDVLRKEADEFFNSISVNDFYSYTKSSFKDNVLADLSYEKAQADMAKCDSFIVRLKSMQKTLQFSEDDMAVSEAAEEFCEYIKRNNEFYWHKFSITHNTSPLPYVITALESYPDKTEEDRYNYSVLIGSLPGLMRTMREKLKHQCEMGILLPEDECKISSSMLKGLKQGSDSRLKRNHDAAFIDESIGRYNDELSKAISYIENDCMTVASSWVPLCRQPGGEEYYQSLIKTYTSYDYTPKEIHEIGLENIEITKQKMQSIINELGYNMSIEKFNENLQHDRRFFDQTLDELYVRMNGFLVKIRPKLKDYFKKLPITDCEVRRIDSARESSTSWGYYAVPVGTEAKGVYYYSGANLSERCQIRAGAVVYHELLPGHHFQMSLIDEDKDLPLCCRQHFNTAFADGWAEYAADLAQEMGMYTKYDLYGRYLWDLILCVRLVVDTGINALGWSLKEVQDFMRENTTLTESEIYTESLRYSADMPGQALAYKMGSLKMHELRDKAEQHLGDGFDIREYHDAVLRYGSIPLSLAEKNVDRYISGIIK